jgi:hypothetical protein
MYYLNIFSSYSHYAYFYYFRFAINKTINDTILNKAQMANRKSFVCSFCQDFLRDPVNLACSCTICECHVKNATRIECKNCEKIYYLPDPRIKENTLLRKLIRKEERRNRSDVGQTTFASIKKSIDEVKVLFEKYDIESLNFDKMHENHFKKLENDINTRRVQLKQIVDELANDMLEKLSTSKSNYQQQKTLNKPYDDKEDFDEFIEKVDSLDIKYHKESLHVLNQNANMLKCRLTELEKWKVGLESYCLKFGATNEKRALKPIFGFLKHKTTQNENENEQESNQVERDQVNRSCAILNLFDGSNSLLQNQAEQVFESFESTCGPITSFSNLQFQAQANSLPNAVILPIANKSQLNSSRRQIESDTQDIIIIKRPQLTLSFDQKKILEDVFNKKTPYPSNDVLEELSKKLKISVVNISNWFTRARLVANRKKPNAIPTRIRNERTKLSPEQYQGLENVFTESKYPNVPRLARKLRLPQMVVNNWLANKRTKELIKQNPKEFKKEPHFFI